jgi:methionyl-tRNA synthetase
MKRYLVTQALPYANGDIHLGHMVEAVQTDVFVRYHRLVGDEVRYVCADDTHGTPIELSALKRKQTPESLIAAVWEAHVRDYAAFSIDFDIFYTTNSDENRRYAEYIYTKLREKGLIVEREVTQYFCEHDKRFLPDRFVVGTCPKCKAAEQYGDVCEVCGTTYDPTDIVEPRCIICRNAPVLKKSKHLFVQLAKRADFLRQFLNTGGVLADDMRNFVTHWIDEGLKEWCISRDGPYFGFRIPDAPDKFFYVWLDAPIGYISSTAKWCADHGEKVDTYWHKDSDTQVVHFIGKDIVYFHALFWPVMLESAEIALPKKIFVHGFLTVAGEKMSKTRGTFVLAREYMERLKHPQAAEYLRFFFASKLSTGAGDLDLSADEFVNRINTTLANNIGNLHHRTFVFCDKYFGGQIPDAPWDATIAAEVEKVAEQIRAAYEATDYRLVVERIHALGNVGNKFYQDSKPWETIKQNPDAAAATMVTCANLVRALAVFLKPIVPAIVAAVEKQLGVPLSWDDHRFSMRNRPAGKTEKLVIPLELEAVSALFTPTEVAAPASAAPLDLKPQIDIAAFQPVDLRVATVISAERVPKSSKLLKLQVALGGEKRQVIAGIGRHYTPEQLPGTQVILVANLKPAKLMGETSEGMILAASDGGKLVLLGPQSEAATGSRVS